MPPSNRLLHLHLHKPIPYAQSLRLQEAVLARHWKYRDDLRSSKSAPSPPSATSDLIHAIFDLRESHPPPPVLITFSTHPTYTVGRRHLSANPLSPSQISFLTGLTNTASNSASTSSASLSNLPSPSVATQAAEFHPSPRGGLLTYHSPGQLTAYQIISLRQFGLSPRAYICLLESAVISTCAALGVPNVSRSAGDPGVWMLESNSPQHEQQNSLTSRKICAIGVQVSRGVAHHGIGLNVHDVPIPASLRPQYQFSDPTGNSLPPNPIDIDNQGQDARGYLSWGFSRIVACGLEGKGVTWLSRELPSTASSSSTETPDRLDVQSTSTVFAQKVLEALNEATLKSTSTKHGTNEKRTSDMLESVQPISEKDIIGI